METECYSGVVETEGVNQESIFDHYKPENEFVFLEKNPFLSESEKEWYVGQNVRRFLYEYVGRSPYSKITYSLKDGLYYGQINLKNMLENTNSLVEENSRERQENTGILKVYGAFAETEKEEPLSVAQVSPPKNWDYGFLFYFRKEFDEKLEDIVVSEYILRYDEAREEIKKSKEILSRLDNSKDCHNAREFLENPIINPPQTPTLETVFLAAGISKEKVRDSFLFEEAVEKYLGYYIDRYADEIIRLRGLFVDYKPTEEEMELIIENLKKPIGGIYNMAISLKGTLDFAKENTVLPVFQIPQVYEEGLSNEERVRKDFGTLKEYYDRSPLLTSGGSCPSTKKNENQRFISSLDITNQLLKGGKVEDLFENECEECGESHNAYFHCASPKDGGCGKLIPSGKGIETCPHCGLNKKDFGKKTGIHCD